MIVVVSIISLLLAAVLPSLSATWNERKASEAEAKVRGSLAAARMKALNQSEQGLLFMLDEDGHQLIYRIEAEPYDPVNESGINAGDPTLDEQSTANRFKVLAGKPVLLPQPYRVCPRSVVDGTTGNWVWDDNELPEKDFAAASATPEMQRNHFTIIFTPDGQLRVGRHVIIHDADDLPGPPTNGDDLGDLTGLPLPVGLAPATTPTWDDGINSGLNIPGAVAGFVGLDDVVININGDAVSFQSVDGLLVYDDETFSELVTVDEQRDFILRTAQPLYISRLSGAVVVGPQGENK